jgi:hypothetical protein
MPNLLNFPALQDTTKLPRPSRLTLADQQIIRSTNKSVLLGTNPREVVELWIYDSDGSIAGQLTLPLSDPLLTVTTIVDQSGPQEVLQVDMVEAMKRMDLQSGRYAMVLNFFRDEVGSENGYKLYISEISPDRTEVLVELVAPDNTQLKDVYEFAQPSVPRLFAQGLIDQVFGKAIDQPVEQIVTLGKVVTQLEVLLAGVSERIKKSGASDLFVSMVDTVIQRTYKLALDLLAADVRNLNVQQEELNAYVITALNTTIKDMQDRGEIPPHFTFV